MENFDQIDFIVKIGTTAFVGLALLILFIVLFYKNHAAKIKRKVAENLLSTALESQNQERQRIAADLHDGVSSDLVGIRNYIFFIIKENKDIVITTALKDIKKGVETAIENTRLVSYQLMPPLLEKRGFIVAIEDYFQQITKQSTIHFTYQGNVTFLTIDIVKSYELFRIIQEFCTNIIKYSEAHNCQLLITNTNSNATLELVDDGVQYNFITTLDHSKGTGLKNINARIQYIKATMIQKKVIHGNHFVITL